MASIGPARGQAAYELLGSLYSPSTEPQREGKQGSHIAVSGNLAAVAVPNDHTGELAAGVVKVYDLTTGQLLHILPNPTPKTSERFGSPLAISGSWVVVGDPKDSTGATGAGVVYVFDLSSATPKVPALVLPNPAPAAYENFGNAVAISGSRIAVAARQDRLAAFANGVAYVYDLASSTPAAPVFAIPNPVLTGSSSFGNAVAISDSRLVVAGSQKYGELSNVGVVHAYDLGGPSPSTPTATFNSPAPASGDLFGNSLAISGSKVLVGASGDSTDAASSGRAYVYDLENPGPMVPAATLVNPTPDPDDLFGGALAISGSRVVIGVRQEDVGAANAGVAYVYDLESSPPEAPALTIANPTPETDDFFGQAVGLSGSRLVVGAPHDSTVILRAGSAYAYDLASATPATPTAILNATTPALDDSFGSNVCVSGTRVVISAHQDNTGYFNGGSVHVYDFADSSPAGPVITFVNPDPFSFSSYGESVATSGTLVAVAITSGGWVDVFDLASPTPTIPIAFIPKPNAVPLSHFGRKVAMSGTRVVVAAPGEPTTVSGAGRVYIYDLASATPMEPIFVLERPGTPRADESFGRAVAIDGTRVAVTSVRGVYIFDLADPDPALSVVTLGSTGGNAVDIFGTWVIVGATNSGNGGVAYVYNLAGATPSTPVWTLMKPTPALSDFYGDSVAIAGHQVVVGVTRDDASAPYAGAVYVYNLASPTPALAVATLPNPDPQAGDPTFRTGDNFGIVDFSESLIAVGAPQARDPFGPRRGAAYVFRNPPQPKDVDDDGLLDSWELAHWSTTIGHAAGDDFDGDGLVELLELGFGLNPAMMDAAAQPAAAIEDGYLTVTIAKRPGVIYEVQTAGDLRSGQPNSFSVASTTVLIDDSLILKARDNFLIHESLARFIRINVAADP